MSHHSAVKRAKRLVARTVPVATLESPLVEQAFALFEAAYDGADRTRFERDLAEKDKVILLHDRATGELKGFSTVLIRSMPAGHRGTVVFSGDTVIHRDYWGQKQLQKAFVRLLLDEKARAPLRPLYWFLISKGYRTYMLLANAFPRAVPRHDRVDDPTLRAALDTLATQRFGAAYDREQGVVRLTAHERVREGLAPVTPRLLTNPHVRYFVSRNADHARGDELACLARVRVVDMLRIGVRLCVAAVRRALAHGEGQRDVGNRGLGVRPAEGV